MKFLMDTSPAKLRGWESPLIQGQLLTPLTSYATWPGEYAIDNGAFTRFDARRFRALMDRCESKDAKGRCLFVVCPDIVGSARRTLELWDRRSKWIKEGSGWKPALVAQDGLEDMEVPWDELHTLFIGGRDPWKDSQAVLDLVKTAKTLGKHVHVGRVNTADRFQRFAAAGADTCDGSGIARFDHMLENLEKALCREPHPELPL